MNIFDEMLKIFREEVINNNLENERLGVTVKSLSPHEAIGDVERQDFPILNGKEIMLECTFKGCKGQAFTSTPASFKGSINDVLNMDIFSNDYDRSIFIAVFNAVTSYLYGICGTVHCKDEQPELCGKKFRDYCKENFKDKKIAIIGYQPAIIENLSKEFFIRVLDLNIDIVNTVRYGVLIEEGDKKLEDVLQWADIILCTGSTLANGSIVNFLNLEIPVYFFGTTISGMAHYLKLPRLCFESTN